MKKEELEILDLAQKEICIKYGAKFINCDLKLKIGISQNVKSDLRPINGMRINPENGTCGWYIWAGEECSDAPDFFVPLHAEHLEQWAPLVLKYLGLPPGWRFLVTEEYEDVWEDDLLLSELNKA